MSQKQNHSNNSEKSEALSKYAKAAQIEQILAGTSKKEQRDILDLVLSQLGYRSIPFGIPTFNPIEGLGRKIKDDGNTIKVKNKGKQKSLYKDDPEFSKILSDEQNLITKIKSRKTELKIEPGERSDDPTLVQFKSELDALHLRKKNLKGKIRERKGIPKPSPRKGKGSST